MSKVYGEGEWKVRQHGASKRRTWRKLHIAVDTASQDIVMAYVTEANVNDCEVLPLLLTDINEPIYQASADGSYDTHDCYSAALKQRASPCFPPRQNASLHRVTDEPWRLRNHAVTQVRYHGVHYNHLFKK